MRIYIIYNIVIHIMYNYVVRIPSAIIHYDIAL